MAASTTVNEIPDVALEYIAQCVAKGYTSGRADIDGINIYWKIDIEAWKD